MRTPGQRAEQELLEARQALERKAAELAEALAGQRRIEEALREEIRTLERLGEMKDELLGRFSHELRTPLGAVLGWSSVLRRRAADDADLKQGLEAIERNARVQARLIEDLLDMSRITSGKVRLDTQPLEPAAVIEAALEAGRSAADAKGIRLEKTLDPAAGPVDGDPHRLQQVVWNLLSNAIRFTPRDGRVQVALSRSDRDIRISVADSGIGIAPELLADVFESFRGADPSATRRHSGLGLGLTVVRRLVELHGGTVHASSPGIGLGSTFTVCLPVGAVRPGGRTGEPG